MNTDLDLVSPNPLPAETYNLYVVMAVVVFLVWMLRLCGRLFGLQDLRMGRQQNRLLSVEGISAHVETVRSLSRAHLHQFLRTQRSVPPAKVPRTVLPFRPTGSGVTNVLAGRDPLSVASPNDFAVSLEFDSDVPCFVQAYWGVVGSAVARVQHKGIRNASARGDAAAARGGKRAPRRRRAGKDGADVELGEGGTLPSKGSGSELAPGAVHRGTSGASLPRVSSLGAARRGYSTVGDGDPEAAGAAGSGVGDDSGGAADVFPAGTYLYRSMPIDHRAGKGLRQVFSVPADAVKEALHPPPAPTRSRVKSSVVANTSAAAASDSVPSFGGGAGVPSFGGAAGAAGAGDDDDALGPPAVPPPFPLNMDTLVDATVEDDSRRRRRRPRRLALVLVIGRQQPDGPLPKASRTHSTILYHLSVVDINPGSPAAPDKAAGGDDDGKADSGEGGASGGATAAADAAGAGDGTAKPVGGEGEGEGAGGGGSAAATSDQTTADAPPKPPLTPRHKNAEWAVSLLPTDAGAVGSSDDVALRQRRQAAMCTLMTMSVHKLLAVTYGTGYELKEAFGLEDEEDMDCVACMADRKSVMLLPCRHVCLCQDCFKHVDKCPVCRSQYTGYSVILWEDEKRLSDDEGADGAGGGTGATGSSAMHVTDL